MLGEHLDVSVAPAPVPGSTALLGGRGIPACRPYRLPPRDRSWWTTTWVTSRNCLAMASPAPRPSRYAGPGADNESVFEQEEQE